MLRTCINTALALVLMSSQAYAHTIKLSPQESKSLTNHGLWTLNATCNIHGSQTSNKILVSVVENKCKVNGRNLSKGQTTSITIKNNQNISVSAEPGTTVNLVNASGDSVQAVCSV